MIGLNQNFASASGTLYQLQIEDRGPVFDAAQEAEVRRVNVIVYANYGEPNARIIHDAATTTSRTSARSSTTADRASHPGARRETRGVIEEREAGQVAKIKAQIRDYY